LEDCLKREQLQRIIYFLVNHITETRYYGLENIPKQGNLIVATNHMSRVDIAVLFANPVRPEITALVADKYVTYFGINWLVRTAGAIYLDRDRADFTAFREAQKLIKSGVAMGIAPEGTRSETGQLLQGKPGMILLAHRTNAVIVPVGQSGTEDAIKKLSRFRKPRITARFGKPFTIPEMPRENRDEAMQQATDEIMCRIAALLPSKYWGFYKDHPRLKELIKEQGGPIIDEWTK
jgi:1-acyl-sn-glycerol-3-phosphate acyltransferase